jgi:hypothetical protein
MLYRYAGLVTPVWKVPCPQNHYAPHTAFLLEGSIGTETMPVTVAPRSHVVMDARLSALGISYGFVIKTLKELKWKRLQYE